MSNYLPLIRTKVYETFSLVVDCWHHVNRGYKHHRIDYCKLAMFLRKMVATNLGVTKMKKDKNKMEHTKELNFKSGITRFTLHNAMFHLILDMDIWGNMHYAQCKTLEKTNKNTKEAIWKGGIKYNLCSRIMKFRTDQLIMTYLCEGNGVTDKGEMDPINGQNKLDPHLIRSLKDYKWLSIFLHQKLNPTDPQYCNGSKLQSKIKHPLLISKFTEKSFKDKIMNAILDEFNINFNFTITYYRKLNFWRNLKKYSVGIGNLLVRINGDKWEFMLIIAFCHLNAKTTENQTAVIGHEVKVSKYYHKKDRNFRGSIQLNDIYCWNVKSIYGKVYYYHLCRNQCGHINNQIKHNWIKSKTIVIFWSLGMGKKCLADPLLDFYDEKDFHYPRRLQYAVA